MKLKVILRNDMRKFSYFKFSEEKKKREKKSACLWGDQENSLSADLLSSEGFRLKKI